MNEKEIQNAIWQAFSDSIILPNTQPLTQWCRSNVYLPNPPYSISGYLDVSKSPYLIGPLEALDNDEVREVVVIGNPRGGKTLIGEAFLVYTLAENPADCWWAVHKADSIKGVMDTRLLPLFEANDKRVVFTDDRFQKTQRFIKFPIGSLKLVGAQNAKSMTQTAGRVLIGDELHEWAEGVLEQYRKRSDDFPYSKKILLLSQAGDENRDLHKAFMAGHQAEWGFTCPKCGVLQEYVFSHKYNDGKYGGLNWERNDTTCPKGIWNIEEAAKTAHYTCTNEKCRENFFDNAKTRRALNDAGQYIIKNPTANVEARSFRWNALATPNIKYAELCRQYLRSDFERQRGLYKSTETFWKQSMSRFWQVAKSQDMFQPIIGAVDSDDSGSLSGSLAGVRVMTVDSQYSGLHPYVVASFNTEKKEVQIITYGKASSWDEIEKVQVDNRVKHQRVMVDCRYQQNDNIMFEAFKRRKPAKVQLPDGKVIDTFSQWIGTFGIGNKKDNSWYHGKDRKTGAEISRPFSQFVRKPVKFGTSQYVKGGLVQVVSFANDPIKDTLKLLMDNKHPEWKLVLTEAAKKDAVFMAEINCEKKICITDKQTGQPKWRWVKGAGDNDMFDCLVLVILSGMIMNFL